MKFTRRTAMGGMAAGPAKPIGLPSCAQAGSVDFASRAAHIGETTLADFEAATGITPVCAVAQTKGPQWFDVMSTPDAPNRANAHTRLFHDIK